MASIGATPAPAETVVEDVPETYGTAEDLVPEDDGHVERLLKKSAALLADIASDFVPPDGYECIQSVARDLASDGWFDPTFASKLSRLQGEWIDAMPVDMLELVAVAKREDLIAHLKGGKGLRGVIRCDRESIKAWKDSVAMEVARAEYEAEHAHEVPAYAPDEPEWAQGRLAAC